MKRFALDSLIATLRYSKALERFYKIFPDRKIEKLKILDAGSGDGRFARILKERGAKRVITADRTPNPGIDIVLDLNHPLPFKDKSFDVAFALAVVEHLGNGELFLLELQRVAKAVIGTTPSPYAKPVLEFLAFLRLVNPEHIKDHKKYWSEKELRNIGYNTEKFEYGLNILFYKINAT